jgi:hypothetical protein
MGNPRTNEPHPGPDLTTQARSVNETRLVRTANKLDEIADVAGGKLREADLDEPWLRALAPAEYGGVPNELLTRWMNLFSDELETVRRARNNIDFGEPIDDGNVAAAAEIADRLKTAAKLAGERLLEKSS